MDKRPTQIGELDIPVRDIRIGDRLREDLGDLESLQLSIELHTMIQPIIVQQCEQAGKYELIDGERRLQVCKRMGEKTIKARLFDAMSIPQKTELELELCIKRKSLHYAEEARAVRKIVEGRKKENMAGGISKFGSRLRNKDIAESLGMSPSALSQNLTIAKALDDYPQLETTCNTRSQALKAISRKEFITPQASMTAKMYEESFIVCTPMELLESLEDKMADLIILQPDTVDPEMLTLAESKLRMGGNIILFINMVDLGGWIPLISSLDLHYSEQPHIWSVKGESTYYSYLWCGKMRDQPLRFLPPMLNYPRPADSLSLKSKSPRLLKNFIHSCTEVGGFVVVPDCGDIDTMRVSYDMQRNVRAACSDNVLRDRLIMTSGR